MKRASQILATAAALFALTGQASFSQDNKTAPWRIGNANLQVTVDKTTGLPTDIENVPTPLVCRPRHHDGETGDNRRHCVAGRWFSGGRCLGACIASPAWFGRIVARSQDHGWLAWDLDFTGEMQRTGHEVILDIPVLAPSFRIFTPSDRGVLDLAMHSTFKPIPYGVNQWNGGSGEAYVLPLVSVFDPASDTP